MNIGLALGSGSSRGWSHIGVINELAQLGITPKIICGTSIGALVGASYLTNNLGLLEEWTRSLTKLETAKFFSINPAINGFINTEKFHRFLNENVASDDSVIEQFDKRFASVATDLETGKEIWFTKGSVLEAVLSSISLPGLFPAIKHHDMWLVDGGLVNPVPVSVCRALGADIVIAVNLNGDIVGKHFLNQKNASKQNKGVVSKISDIVKEYAPAVLSNSTEQEQPPSLLNVIAGSFNITQDRITKSRMAEDPPDILLAPKLSHIGQLEFYRADEAISEGRRCVQRLLPEIKRILKLS